MIVISMSQFHLPSFWRGVKLNTTQHTERSHNNISTHSQSDSIKSSYHASNITAWDDRLKNWYEEHNWIWRELLWRIMRARPPKNTHALTHTASLSPSIMHIRSNTPAAKHLHINHTQVQAKRPCSNSGCPLLKPCFVLFWRETHGSMNLQRPNGPFIVGC